MKLSPTAILLALLFVVVMTLHDRWIYTHPILGPVSSVTRTNTVVVTNYVVDVVGTILMTNYATCATEVDVSQVPCIRLRALPAVTNAAVEVSRP